MTGRFGRVIVTIVLGCLGSLFLVALSLHALDVLLEVSRPYVSQAAPHPQFPELGVEWRMHPVDNPGDWLPNGLDAADANGDGRDDYLTNYEFNGRLRVSLHPGADLAGAGRRPGPERGERRLR
jgi:hypothetical protein